MAAGTSLPAHRVPSALLKTAFGWCVLAMGVARGDADGGGGGGGERLTQEELEKLFMSLA